MCVCVCVPLSFEQLSGAGQMARDGCDYELVIEGWHSVALTLCSLSPNYSLPEFGFIVKMFLYNFKCLWILSIHNLLPPCSYKSNEKIVGKYLLGTFPKTIRTMFSIRNSNLFYPSLMNEKESILFVVDNNTCSATSKVQGNIYHVFSCAFDVTLVKQASNSSKKRALMIRVSFVSLVLSTVFIGPIKNINKWRNKQRTHCGIFRVFFTCLYLSRLICIVIDGHVNVPSWTTERLTGALFTRIGKILVWLCICICFWVSLCVSLTHSVHFYDLNLKLLSNLNVLFPCLPHFK